jgi:hypothetical protein
MIAAAIGGVVLVLVALFGAYRFGQATSEREQVCRMATEYRRQLALVAERQHEPQAVRFLRANLTFAYCR